MAEMEQLPWREVSLKFENDSRLPVWLWDTTLVVFLWIYTAHRSLFFTLRSLLNTSLFQWMRPVSSAKGSTLLSLHGTRGIVTSSTRHLTWVLHSFLKISFVELSFSCMFSFFFFLSFVFRRPEQLEYYTAFQTAETNLALTMDFVRQNELLVLSTVSEASAFVCLLNYFLPNRGLLNRVQIGGNMSGEDRAKVRGWLENARFTLQETNLIFHLPPPQ